MKLFAVYVNRDDTVAVIERDVKKETPQFYVMGERAKKGDWRFGSASRIPKFDAYATPRAAVEAYMKRRQADKQNAQAVIGQAAKQIASANELLMHLPADEPAEEAHTSSSQGRKES